MSNTKWTPRDEAELQVLMQRKREFMNKHRAQVMGIVRKIHPLPPEEMVRDLCDKWIENADEIRDALSPFDSGVRAAKEG